MFLHLSVSHSVYGGGGMQEGHARQGGHAWQGACIVGVMLGRGCASQGCVCGGGMHGGGGGHSWQGGLRIQERWPLKQMVHILLECILVIY